MRHFADTAAQFAVFVVKLHKGNKYNWKKSNLNPYKISLDNRIIFKNTKLIIMRLKLNILF